MRCDSKLTQIRILLADGGNVAAVLLCEFVAIADDQTKSEKFIVFQSIKDQIQKVTTQIVKINHHVFKIVLVDLFASIKLEIGFDLLS